MIFAYITKESWSGDLSQLLTGLSRSEQVCYVVLDMIYSVGMTYISLATMMITKGGEFI
jgi:hypothetical protein